MTRGVKKIKAYPNRWGEGKVHFPENWDEANAPRTLCGLMVHGEVVDDANKVTCKKCIKADHP